MTAEPLATVTHPRGRLGTIEPTGIAGAVTTVVVVVLGLVAAAAVVATPTAGPAANAPQSGSS